MKTGELATRAAVNPQTLRYCERLGLLSEPLRSTSGYHMHRPRGGLWGALVLGAVFGLAWTPRLGPTLAGVIALVAGTRPAMAVATILRLLGLVRPMPCQLPVGQRRQTWPRLQRT